MNTLLAATVTEAAFQRMVVEFLQLRGWLVSHTYDSRRTGPDAGVPDLLAARNGRVLFAELKRQKGRVSEAQTRWLTHLSASGKIETYVWRPSDWAEIERVVW